MSAEDRFTGNTSPSFNADDELEKLAEYAGEIAEEHFSNGKDKPYAAYLAVKQVSNNLNNIYANQNRDSDVYPYLKDEIKKIYKNVHEAEDVITRLMLKETLRDIGL